MLKGTPYDAVLSNRGIPGSAENLGSGRDTAGEGAEISVEIFIHLAHAHSHCDLAVLLHGRSPFLFRSGCMIM